MMKKLHSSILLLLVLCIGFAGVAKNPQYTDLWSTPVAFDLVPVALVNLPDGNLHNASSEYSDEFEKHSNEIQSFLDIEAYFAPPCDNIGEACDDGESNTVNDKVDPDCKCRGVAIAPTCDEVQIDYEINGGLRETGAAAITVSQTDSVELFANVQDYVVRDPQGAIVPGNTINNISTTQAGDYTLNTTFKVTTPTGAPINPTASSEQPGNLIENAFNGNPNNFWHTVYGANDTGTAYPHSVELDMGANSVLSGFTYLPRQDGVTNGRVAGYKIFVSNSKTEWGTEVAAGTWLNNALLKTVTFPAKQGRYLRFEAISSINGLPFAAAAGITVIRATAIRATASSFHGPRPPSDAVDGDRTTLWHTRWEEPNPAVHPHHIILDLGIDSNVSGLEYLPRQDVGTGRINGYNIYVSDSSTEWVTSVPVLSGKWDNDGELKEVTFTETRGRYLILQTIAADAYDTFVAAAEVRPIRTTVNLPCTKTITINVDPIDTYTFDGTWDPSIPTATTANDILNIVSGNADISGAVSFNTVTVEAGASLTVNENAVLTAGAITLKSIATSFSSLIDNGEIVGVINYERWVNQIGTDAGGGNDLISSPVSNETFNIAFTIANPNLPENPDIDGEFAFAPYNVEVGAYQNFNILADYSEDEPIESGRGYRAATNVVEPQTGNTLTFTGSAATGNVSIAISDAVAGRAWNLIGNPYPSYLDFDSFFNANLNEFDSRGAYQAIYGYKGNSNVWETWNLARLGNEDLIAPGQGFFVKADTGGGTIQFTPAMRRTGSSDDFIEGRQENINKALSKLKLSEATNTVTTSIYFIDGTTKGLDPGYDAAAYGATKVDFSMFTNLLEDNTGLDIAIQSLPYNDYNDVIVPLGIMAKTGVELSISIDELSTLPSNINVYLEDTQDETLTLLNDGDFKFTPTSNEKVNGRFNVHYSSKTLSVEDLDANDNLRIYTTASPRSLFIVGQLAKATKANLYDIQGRLVLSQDLNPNTTENTMDISTLGTGIYVVKVNNDNQIKTQKVIIK